MSVNASFGAWHVLAHSKKDQLKGWYDGCCILRNVMLHIQLIEGDSTVSHYHNVLNIL